jgi:hypothetical protein
MEDRLQKQHALGYMPINKKNMSKGRTCSCWFQMYIIFGKSANKFSSESTSVWAEYFRFRQGGIKKGVNLKMG